MLVVLANDLPPAVRGRMKLWFVEPRPNVFVSGVKDSVAQTVVDYLLQYTPVESGLMLFRSIPQPPGYEIRYKGEVRKPIIDISGLQPLFDRSCLSAKSLPGPIIRPSEFVLLRHPHSLGCTPGQTQTPEPYDRL